MASAGRDALTECGGIIKRARTYRACADGCGAGAGRVATMGRAPRDDGSAPRDDRYAACDTVCSARRWVCSVQRRVCSARRRIDSSRRQVRNARRLVRELKKKRATTGTQRPKTGTGSGDDGCARATTGTQRPMTNTGSGDDGCCSCDDGGDCATTAKIARRRVVGRAMTGPTPRGRVAAIVYKGGRLDWVSCSD